MNIKGKISNNVILYNKEDKCIGEDTPSRHEVTKKSRFGYQLMSLMIIANKSVIKIKHYIYD